jgi:hypothetical protein
MFSVQKYIFIAMMYEKVSSMEAYVQCGCCEVAGTVSDLGEPLGTGVSFCHPMHPNLFCLVIEHIIFISVSIKYCNYFQAVHLNYS